MAVYMKKSRDALLSQAIAAGKFTESERDFYERCWSIDPSATLNTVLAMSGTATKTSPAAPPAVADGGDAYVGTALSGDERSRIAAAQAGRQHSRIVSEPGA